jgi:alpha-mannosidase
VALFTDCKYGYAVHGNVMRVSLLRGPGHPDPQADKGEHSFRFAVYPHTGDHVAGEVVRRAHEFNNPLLVVPGRLEAQSWFAVDSAHLVIDTVKKAEDSDAIIVRLYEAHGARGKACLRTALPVKHVQLVNLLEEPHKALKLKRDGSIPLAFRPFEVISLLVTCNS